jgi:hypothetical protein
MTYTNACINTSITKWKVEIEFGVRIYNGRHYSIKRRKWLIHLLISVFWRNWILLHFWDSVRSILEMSTSKTNKVLIRKWGKFRLIEESESILSCYSIISSLWQSSIPLLTSLKGQKFLEASQIQWNLYFTSKIKIEFSQWACNNVLGSL